MNLESHYKNLYKTSRQKILNNDYQIDDLIDSKNDQRFGITLIIRPPLEVKNEIQQFLNKLKIIEPNQYYYSNTGIHITVMSIISCYNCFALEKANISEYIETINNSITNSSKLEIKFKGITASPSCIMTQGFPLNQALKTIRNNLRKNFKNTTLEQSLDKRYAIQTAHSTVFRFKEKLEKRADLLKALEDYRYYDFGSFKVKSLELVYNDWYQKKEHVKNLFEFHL
ncbi:mutarotase [uncultured Algibacter sp.]|uniref:2'-5' RNA ligase family protein n=1 Tax=uncultured Algibacter sp. TaxID=298659 RepID=UPI00261106E6|nr:mutarotase [uncultured Algibacter sp.]